jgi:hypothetical protein
MDVKNTQEPLKCRKDPSYYGSSGKTEGQDNSYLNFILTCVCKIQYNT